MSQGVVVVFRMAQPETVKDSDLPRIPPEFIEFHGPGTSLKL